MILTTRIADPNKVEIVDALVAARQIINDDNVDMSIKDTVFDLSHCIVNLVERIEEVRRVEKNNSIY